jgi:hypothetical protein
MRDINVVEFGLLHFRTEAGQFCRAYPAIEGAMKATVKLFRDGEVAICNNEGRMKVIEPGRLLNTWRRINWIGKIGSRPGSGRL